MTKWQQFLHKGLLPQLEIPRSEGCPLSFAVIPAVDHVQCSVCSVSQRWAAGTCLPAQIQLGGSCHTQVSTTGTTEFAGDIKWPNPELTHITVSQSLENFFIGFWDILSLNNFYNFRLIVFLFSQILCELPLILHKLSPFQYFYTEVFKETGCVKWIIFRKT